MNSDDVIAALIALMATGEAPPATLEDLSDLEVEVQEIVALGGIVEVPFEIPD